MRDRLIEIIKKTVMPYFAEFIADDLLADGWMRPPCKIGDKVFRIVEMRTGVTEKYNLFIEKGKVYGEITHCKPIIKRFVRCVIVTKNNIVDCCEEYGKKVFPTRKEAEQALKGGVQG